MKNNVIVNTLSILTIIFLFLEFSEGKRSRKNRDSDDYYYDSDPSSYTEVECGDHQLSPSSTPYRIKNSYNPNDHECEWKFLGTSECNPQINCDTFSLVDSPDCTEEFLEISDGSSDMKTRFCGTNGPKKSVSGSSTLVVFFNTSLTSAEKRFRCNVQCATPPQLKFPINFLPTQPPKYVDCLCGVAGPTDAPGRIVNGTIAEKGKWRWQAAMVLRGTDSPVCGGSLINDKYILTAAHCVVTTGLALIPSAAEIILNEYDITMSNETKTIRRNIVTALPHPQYNVATQENDIALLEITPPVNLLATEEPIVTPVCLPSKGEKNLYVGDLGTVTGWGTTTEGGDQPAVLMQVDVPVISNEECNKHYDGKITSSMICAGYPDGGKDSCQGDSGGPFVLQGSNGRYTEIGVVSFGQGCARAGKEGVYARVTELNDWIRSNMRGGTWCKE